VAGAASCPACDAPAPPGARACASCGYDFLESETAGPRLDRGVLAVVGGAAALAALGVAAALVVGSGGGEPAAPAPLARTTPRTQETAEVVARRPLSTRGAERVLAELFISARDQRHLGGQAVRCSRREPWPAHSIRRCEIRYPNGDLRHVALLTNARGNEVLSQR
jgi:ribosomal protein L40E